MQEGSTCAIRGEATRRFSLDLLSKNRAQQKNLCNARSSLMNSRSNLHLALDQLMISLLGFGVENKKNPALRKPTPRLDLGRWRWEDQSSYLLATVQWRHFSRSGRLDGELEKREGEHSHEQILITVDSLERRSNARSLYRWSTRMVWKI